MENEFEKMKEALKRIASFGDESDFEIDPEDKVVKMKEIALIALNSFNE